MSVIFAGRVDDLHPVFLQKCAKRVDVFAASHLERVMMKANIALAILAFPTFGIGGGNPKQRLSVAPSGHIVVFVLEREAEKGQQLVIESLRPPEIADAENEMINTDNARHEVTFRSCLA